MNGHTVIAEIQSTLAEYADVGPEEFVPSFREMLDQLGDLNRTGDVDRDVSTTYETIAGIQCGVFENSDLPRKGTIFYLHGGGFLAGSASSHRFLLQALAEASQYKVIVPDYPLLPEASAQEMLVAIRAIFEQIASDSMTATPLVIIGDSAGGALALSLAIMQSEADSASADAVVTFSAITDLSMESPSLEANKDHDIMLSAEMLDGLYAMYLAGSDPNDGVFSPLHCDLKNLPPLLMQVGANEILLDDSTRFATKARAAGSDVKLEIWPEMFHVWQNFPARLPEAKQALSSVTDFLSSLEALPNKRESGTG